MSTPDRHRSRGALDARVRYRSVLVPVQRAMKVVIVFLAVPVAVFLPPLFRKLDDKLLDITTGHRAAWPMGDSLLECASQADEDA